MQVFSSADEALVGLLSACRKVGVYRKPAWQEFGCTEFPYPVLFKIPNPLARFITIPERKANHALAVAESLWVARGLNNLDCLPGHYSKAIYAFADDGKHYRAGYGPRIRHFDGRLAPDQYEVGDRYPNTGVDQLRFVVDQLKKDPFTRQAVITIHDPNKDDFDANGNLLQTKDTPCLAGDTLVCTTEGKKKIQDMKAGDFVFNYDEDEECILVNKVLWAGKTGTTNKYLKVTLTTGEVIRITPNHKVFTKTYEYVGPARQPYSVVVKPAEELEEGDYLLTTVFDYENSRFKYSLRENTNNGNMHQIHRSYYEAFHGVSLGKDEVVHHKNGEHSDNSIDNLDRMTTSEHNSYHRLVENPMKSEESREKRKFLGKTYKGVLNGVFHKGKTKEDILKEYRNAIAGGQLSLGDFPKASMIGIPSLTWCIKVFGSQAKFTKELLESYPELAVARKRSKGQNPRPFIRVSKIEEVEEDLDVYNLTVENHHNYVIEGGWIVKNCTRSLHFMSNSEGKLDLTVHMRSNDIIRGMSAINIPLFTFLQQLVSMMTGIPLGNYYHVADSLHYYDIHEELCDTLCSVSWAPVDMTGFSYPVGKDPMTLASVDNAIDFLLSYEKALRIDKKFDMKNPFTGYPELQVFEDYAEVFRAFWGKKEGLSCDSTSMFHHPQLVKIFKE